MYVVIIQMEQAEDTGGYLTDIFFLLHNFIVLHLEDILIAGIFCGL